MSSSKHGHGMNISFRTPDEVLTSVSVGPMDTVSSVCESLSAKLVLKKILLEYEGKLMLPKDKKFHEFGVVGDDEVRVLYSDKDTLTKNLNNSFTSGNFTEAVRFAEELHEYGCTYEPLTATEHMLVLDSFYNYACKQRTEQSMVKGNSNNVTELCDKALRMAKVLSSYNRPSSKRIEAGLFRMRGDICRLRLSIVKTPEMTTACEAFYDAAVLTSESLSSTDPAVLQLSLNRGIFFYDVHNDLPKGTKILKDAFDKSLFDLDKLSEKHYKESTTIMQVIRDHLAVWNS